MPALSPTELALYLSGGTSNASGDASLGGLRSTVTNLWPQAAIVGAPAPPFTVVGAFGHSGAGIGAGSLSYTAGTSSVVWTPAGGSAGVAVALANDGSTAIATDSTDEAGIIFVDNAAPPGANATYPITVARAKNALYDNISIPQLTSGHVDYRCVFLRPNGTWTGAGVYLSGQPASGVTIDIGIDPLANDTNGVAATTIADETTAPAGVTFSAPTTEPGALSIGTITSGNEVAVWIRRTSLAGQSVSLDDAVELIFTGTVAAPPPEWHRIQFTNVRTVNRTYHLGELEFRSVAAGQAISETGNPATAFSTSVLTPGDFGPEHAFSGITTDEFIAQIPAIPPEVLGTRFIGGKSVVQIAMFNKGLTDAPEDFAYQTSEDSTNGFDGTWTTVQTYTLTGPVANTWFLFTVP